MSVAAKACNLLALLVVRVDGEMLDSELSSDRLVRLFRCRDEHRNRHSLLCLEEGENVHWLIPLIAYASE